MLNCGNRRGNGATKTAAAGHWPGRCHETPLEAPREIRRWSRGPNTRPQQNHIFLSIFFFFGFFFAAMIDVLVC